MTPEVGDRDRWILRVHWPPRWAELVSSWLSKIDLSFLIIIGSGVCHGVVMWRPEGSVMDLVFFQCQMDSGEEFT